MNVKSIHCDEKKTSFFYREHFNMLCCIFYMFKLMRGPDFHYRGRGLEGFFGYFLVPRGFSKIPQIVPPRCS